MESEIICLDSSVLIEYYRKKNKSNSFFYSLTEKYNRFAISVITEFEVYSGSNETQDKFWNDLFEKITVLDFTSDINKKAIAISRKLRKQNKQIAIPDLLIGATSLSSEIKLATLNKKDFSKIDGLELITP